MLGEASVAARTNQLEIGPNPGEGGRRGQAGFGRGAGPGGLSTLEQVDVAAADIEAWNRQLPAGSDEHPDIWVVRGLWTKRAGPAEAAGRCFWEAVRRGPNHHSANYQLALILGQLESKDENGFAGGRNRSRNYQRHAGRFEYPAERYDDAVRGRGAQRKAGQALGGWGWSRVALLVDPTLKWAEDARDRAAATIKSSPPQVLPEFAPGSRYDYSAWAPRMDWPVGPAQGSQ